MARVVENRQKMKRLSIGAILPLGVLGVFALLTSWPENTLTILVLGGACFLVLMDLFATYLVYEDLLKPPLDRNRVGEAVAKGGSGIQEIMDQIEEGILTFGADLSIDPIHSQFVSSIFSEPDGLYAHKNILTVLLRDSDLPDDQKSLMAQVLKLSLGESKINWRLNQGQLPSFIRLGVADQEKMISLNWQALTDQEGVVEKIMLVARDITLANRLEREIAQTKAHNQGKVEKLGQILAVSRASVEKFIEMSLGRLEVIKQQTGFEVPSKSTIFLGLHTIKGGARTFQLTSVSNKIHQMEQELAAFSDGDEALSKSFMAMLPLLEEELREYHHILKDILGGTFWEAKDLMQACQPYISMAKDRIAHEVNQTIQQFEVVDQVLYWPRKYLDVVEEVAPLIFGNSIDHGFILPAKAGHAPAEIIFKLKAWVHEGRLLIEFFDSGVGLNFEALRQLAVAKGFDDSTDGELTDLIFMEGSSTAPEVTATSGRGVGLAAVKSLVEGQAGEVWISSDGEGTVVTISFPNAEGQTDGRLRASG